MTVRTVATALGILAIGAVVAAIALGSDSGGDSNTSVKGSESKPRYCPKGDESGYDANDLVGRNVSTAKERAKAENCKLRVVRRNGTWLAVSDDWRPDRINVAVRGYRVTRITGIH
jgi:hypothetical protein